MRMRFAVLVAVASSFAAASPASAQQLDPCVRSCDLQQSRCYDRSSQTRASFRVCNVRRDACAERCVGPRPFGTFSPSEVNR